MLGFNPHEMYKYVLIAMSPLAVLAIITGYFQKEYEHFVTALLPSYHMSDHTHHIAWILGALVVIVATTGIVIAYKKYAGKGSNAWKRDEKVESSFIYKLLINQYYVPYAYDRFIVQPYIVAADKFWELDKKIVDGTVDMIARVIYKTGDKSRAMQTGNLSTYLNWMGAGALLLIVAAAISAVIG